MATLLAIFVRVIVPVSVVVIVGFAAGRSMAFDQRTLSRLGLYVLVPCMAFAAMARTTLSVAELGQITVFCLTSTVLLYPLSVLAARTLRLGPTAASAFHIGVLFANVVNVGFPVLLLAYGQPAIERGLVVGITMQIVLQSFGVYLAARGKVSVRQSFASVWRMPGLYGMILGLAANLAHIEIPASIYNPIKMVGDSLVPFLLLLLGMQLTGARFRGHLKAAAVATVLRLGVAAGMAYVLADWMGLQGITRKSVIVECGMPSAIFGVVLAQEFETAPELMTVIISVSTVVSIFTLTVILAVV